MVAADDVVLRVRRDLALAALVRILLVGGLAALFVLAPAMGGGSEAMIPMVFLLGVWFVLGVRNLHAARLAAGASNLIASGQFDAAEVQLEQSLRRFSLFRAAKLNSLHQLARLRHAQRRWRDTVVLCQALLGQKLGSLRGLARPARLLLASAALRLGDLRSAYTALSGLLFQRLPLAETLSVQMLHLDYLARISAWDSMLLDVGDKIQLAELMPAGQAARAQALLALAAGKVGRADLSQWLRQRVRLLVSRDEIVEDHPLLAQWWDDDPEGKDQIKQRNTQ